MIAIVQSVMKDVKFAFVQYRGQNKDYVLYLYNDRTTITRTFIATIMMGLLYGWIAQRRLAYSALGAIAIVH